MSGPLGGINMTTLWINVVPSLAGLYAGLKQAGSQGAQQFSSTFNSGWMASLNTMAEHTNKVFESIFKGMNAGLEQGLKGAEAAMKAVFEGTAPDVASFAPFFSQLEGMIGSAGEKMVGWIPIIGEVSATFISGWTEAFQTVTGAAGEFMGLFQEMGNKWQEISRQIQGATGATEQQLDRYLTITQKVLESGDIVHLEAVASAIGIIGDRLRGVTTEQLEEFTGLVAESQELIGKFDVGQAVSALNEWGVAGADATNKLAGLVHVSQDAKMPFDVLTRQLVQTGPIFQDFGLSLDQTATLLGRVAKEGIDPSRLSYSFQRAATTLAKNGEDIKGTLKSVFEYTRNLVNSGQEEGAYAYLESLFGPYGGPKILQMVKDHNIAIDELMGSLHDHMNENANDIGEQLERTKTLGDVMMTIKNRLMGEFRGISEAFAKSLTSEGQSLSGWFEEHHAQLLEFAKETFDAILGGVQHIIHYTSVALETVAPFLNMVKEAVIGITGGILGLIQAVAKAADWLLPDSWGGKAAREVGQAAGEAMTGLKKLEDIDLGKWARAGADGLNKLGAEVPKIRDHLDAAIQPSIDMANAFEGLRTHMEALPEQRTFKLKGDGLSEVEAGLKKIGITFERNQDGVVTKVKAANKELADEFENWFKKNTGKELNVKMVLTPPEWGVRSSPVPQEPPPGSGHRGYEPGDPNNPDAPRGRLPKNPFGGGSLPSGGLPNLSTMPSFPMGAATPSGDTRTWLSQSLAAAGLSPDQIKGILAMNLVEGGENDPKSILGFMESQAVQLGGQGGPQGHLNAFLNQQWNDMSRRGPGGSIPGVGPDGKVTDWDAYMNWIRVKIVGQTGSPTGPDGMAQPAPQDYQRRLMEALGNVGAVPTAPQPMGTGLPSLLPGIVGMPSMQLPQLPTTMPGITPPTGGLPSMPTMQLPQLPVSPAPPVPQVAGQWQTAENGWQFYKSSNAGVYWVSPGMPVPDILPNGSPSNPTTGTHWELKPSDGKGGVFVLAHDDASAGTPTPPSAPVTAPPGSGTAHLPAGPHAAGPGGAVPNVGADRSPGPITPAAPNPPNLSDWMPHLGNFAGGGPHLPPVSNWSGFSGEGSGRGGPIGPGGVSGKSWWSRVNKAGLATTAGIGLAAGLMVSSRPAGGSTPAGLSSEAEFQARFGTLGRSQQKMVYDAVMRYFQNGGKWASEYDRIAFETHMFSEDANMAADAAAEAKAGPRSGEFEWGKKSAWSDDPSNPWRQAAGGDLGGPESHWTSQQRAWVDEVNARPTPPNNGKMANMTEGELRYMARLISGEDPGPIPTRPKFLQDASGAHVPYEEAMRGYTPPLDVDEVRLGRFGGIQSRLSGLGSGITGSRAWGALGRGLGALGRVLGPASMIPFAWGAAGNIAGHNVTDTDDRGKTWGQWLSGQRTTRVDHNWFTGRTNLSPQEQAEMQQPHASPSAGPSSGFMTYPDGKGNTIVHPLDGSPDYIVPGHSGTFGWTASPPPRATGHQDGGGIGMDDAWWNDDGSRGQVPYLGPIGRDSVHAVLEPGEFVVKRDIALQNLTNLWLLNSGVKGFQPGGAVGFDTQGAQIDTIAISQAVAQAFPGQIASFGLYRSADGFNEHSSGEAVDISPGGIGTAASGAALEVGNAIVQMALGYADQFGVQYAIWQNKMWYPGGRVEDYGSRGGVTDAHMDHVHIRTVGGGFPQGGGPGADFSAGLPKTGTTSSTPAPLAVQFAGGAGQGLPGVAGAGIGAGGATGMGSGGGGGGGGGFNMPPGIGPTSQGWVNTPNGGQVFLGPGEYQRYYYNQAKDQADIERQQREIVDQGNDVTDRTAKLQEAYQNWLDSRKKYDAATKRLESSLPGWKEGDPIPAGFDTGQFEGKTYTQLLNDLDSKSEALSNASKGLETAKQGLYDKNEKLQETLAKPPDIPKGAKITPDQNAEQLGKGLVTGLLQGLGFDGSVFSNPLDWGIWKLFTGAVNYGGGLLKQAQEHGSPMMGGSQGLQGNAGGSAILGGLENLIPGVSTMLQPTGAHTGPGFGMPGAMSAPSEPNPGPTMQGGTTSNINFNLSGIMNEKQIGPIAADYTTTNTRAQTYAANPSTIPIQAI